MIITLYDYDEFLLTERNLDTFIGRFKEDNADVKGLIEELSDGGLRVELLNVQVTKFGLEYIEKFWEANPDRTVIGDSDTAEMLYEIIDDIDTISDIAGGNDRLYRRLAETRIKDRFDFCVSDGLTVKFNSTKEMPCGAKERSQRSETDEF